MVKKSEGNTRLYIVLGILAIAIILGSILGSKYMEKFTSQKTLIYFYMTNCPHCINFESEWTRIQDIIKTESKYSGLNVKKLNIQTDDEAKEYKDVNGAPTIMLLPSKKIYNGEREAYKILDWTTNS